MSTTPELEPTAEFERRLEHEIRSALRRESRFAPAGGWSSARVLRQAALVLVSIALGAGAVVAAERLRDLREREILVARAELLIDVQRARLERRAAEFERQEQLFAAGVLAGSELVETRLEREQAEYELRRLEIDANEVRSTGREPDDELDADLVSGRDFVLERSRLEIERLRLRRVAFAEEGELQRARIAAGVASDHALIRAQAELARIDASLAGVQRRIDLRREFLAGALEREEVRLHALRAAAETARDSARAMLTTLEPELARWKELVEGGFASASDTSLVEERAALEAEVELAELEIELVDARLNR